MPAVGRRWPSGGPIAKRSRKRQRVYQGSAARALIRGAGKRTQDTRLPRRRLGHEKKRQKPPGFANTPGCYIDEQVLGSKLVASRKTVRRCRAVRDSGENEDLHGQLGLCRRIDPRALGRVRRVMSRIRPLNLSRAFGAMRRSLSSFEMLNPRNFRSSGRATALFASFTLSRSLLVKNRLTEAMTRSPARWLRAYMLQSSAYLQKR
jgi:hypothetical protein